MARGVVGEFAAGRLVQSPGVGRAWVALQRAAQHDGIAHGVGPGRGETARVGAAQAPADQTDAAAAAFVQLVEALEHRRRHTAARSEVAPQAPAMRVVAAFAQVRAQQACRSVAREQAGQYKHRMAVALGGQPQQRPCRQRGRELMRGARLGPEKPARRG